MISFLKSFNERMKARFVANDLFHENEIQANKLLMGFLVGNAVIMIIIFAAIESDIFPVSGRVVPTVVRSFIGILALWFISRLVKQDAWWLKYLLLLGLTAVYAQIDALLTHKVAILMILPVLCSSRYFSRNLTVAMSVITSVVFFVSAYIGAMTGWINMNDVVLPVGTTITNTDIWLGSGIEAIFDRAEYVHNTLLFSFIPKLLMFSVAAFICTNIARHGRRMVIKQKEMSESSSRMETELQMATQIQEGMLPNIYPPFPNRKEFDIYGTMNAAREVGGDFYDFFLVDDDHLAMVIADVSGKGIPAALFMMASKIILANNAMMKQSPGEILALTNNMICSNNPQEMFVTVWLGILEISTGLLMAANAGHEYPALKRGDKFELLKDKHNFVIGGFEDIDYEEYTVQLMPGDKLFLYTDGVPEAADSNNTLFGTARMIEALNIDPDAPPRTILENVHRAVDTFVGKAEQFDDLTMLCMTYGKI